MKTVIVGGVAGGAGTAARLRRLDEQMQIVMLEKGGYISFANCGLPYYLGGVIEEREALLLQTPAGFSQRFRVDVRIYCEVLTVDTENKTVLVKNLATGESFREAYDTLVLSPGAQPVVPQLAGTDELPLFTLRSIEDTDAIDDFLRRENPREAVVLGAGAIGLEMAENLLHRGLQVHVIEMQHPLAALLDPDMCGGIAKHLREKGISLHTGRRAVGLCAQGVMTNDGRLLPAQMALASVGVRPATAFLHGSGIALGARGEILTDRQMRTTAKDVYAVGDAVSCVRFGELERVSAALASPANKQARIAADVICGRQTGYLGSQSTGIVKVFEMTAAATGESERTLQAKGTPYRKSITHSPSNASYYPGFQQMTVKLLFTPDDGRILGAQIVGGQGVDKRIDVLATAVRGGLTADALREVELSYAPPFSSAKDPVNMAGCVADNLLRGLSVPFYVEQLSQLPRDAVLVDVRTAQEYAQGTIPGAVNLPVDELRERMEELDPKKTLYIFCRIGQRGLVAERMLVQNGFRVRNLSGGYLHYVMQEREEQEQ